MFGHAFLKSRTPWNLIDSFARFDGQHYKHIATEGYEYQEDRRSVVAFFPAYPLLAHALTWLTGLGIVPALLAVSNLGMLAAFALTGTYLNVRCAASGLGESNAACATTPRWSLAARTYALLAMAFFPTTVFFRMAYSESLFLCVSILFMLGIARGWRLPMLAVTAGLATAVRPVGIALLLPLVWHVCRISGSKAAAARQLAYAVPLACWGLIAYMAFQYWRFGEPFAFALTQKYWAVRHTGTIGDKFLALASWEPVWSVYARWAPGDWRSFDPTGNPLFSLQFANPIYFVGMAVLIAVGTWKKWLNSYEILLSIGLLAIPYVTRAYETCMASQGRFAAVVFPVYIVMGELLARMPKMIAISLLALSGVMMGLYAALFAAGYAFF
jgi:hypothetical protein